MVSEDERGASVGAPLDLRDNLVGGEDEGLDGVDFGGVGEHEPVVAAQE